MDFTGLEKNIRTLVMLEHTLPTDASAAMAEMSRAAISTFKVEFAKRVPAEKREVALESLESDIRRFEALARRQWS